MEVKAGYIKTEIGIIPDDWELKRFKEISWVNQGLQIAIAKRLKMPKKKSKIYITIQYLNDGKDAEYIDNYSSSVACTKNDVLMTRTGNTGIVVTGYEGVFHNNFFKINFNRKILYKEFLVFYLSLPKTRKIILEKAGSSTIPDLNHNDFYSIPIPLPPTLEEQRAIATVLSDTDELISSLDKLITKKRNIKQATMQQLLTGKKRLPGFSGEWEEKTFYEIFRKHSSKDYQIQSADYNVSGKIPVVDQGKKIVVAYTNNENKCFSCPSKGIIVFGDHTRIIKYINFDFAVGADGTQLLSTLNNFSAQYFYYLLLIKEIPNTGYNRHFKFILEMTFSAPTFDEQQAISAILTEMDSEIESLEQKRVKYKAIKQGMMQQLLTGKTRLV